MTEHPHPTAADDTEKIRQRRMQTLLGVWTSLLTNSVFFSTRLRLSTPLANEVVEHYIADRAVLKLRYHIEDRIQVYKIAGLMTASIMRYRPIIPVTDEFKDGREIYANEIFAIYHALAICAEHSDRSYATEVLDEPWFSKWRDEMTYFLHFRNHTPEALCMIFLTLMELRFPANLVVSKD
jgi:hypothetical protein